MRAKRIALLEQLGALTLREALGGEQVLRHVRVEARAEDSEDAFHCERQRGDAEREQGHWRPGTKCLPRPLDAPPEEEHRTHRHRPHGDRGEEALARQAHRRPADRAHQG
jgi:hypothetical protein